MQTNANFLKLSPGELSTATVTTICIVQKFLARINAGYSLILYRVQRFFRVRELSFVPGKIGLLRPKPEKTLQKIALLLIAPKFGAQEVIGFTQSDRISCHIRQCCWRQNFLKERVKWRLAVELRARKLSISKRLFSMFSTKKMTI